MKNSKKNILLLGLIILLGIFLRVYAGYKKTYYHHDEVFSFELINDDIWGEERINEENWNKVIDGKIFKSDVEISKGERFNFEFVNVVAEKEPHPPLYYISLHIFQSLISDGKISKWPGIVLNIIIFIITSLFLFRTAKILIKDKFVLFLPNLIFSVNSLCVSMSIYLRMYELVTLFTVTSFYFNLRFLSEKKISYKLMACLGFSAILGGLTHFYYFIFIFNLFFVSSIYFYKRKNFELLKKYFLTMVLAGVIYLLIWPYLFDQIFGATFWDFFMRSH